MGNNFVDSNVVEDNRVAYGSYQLVITLFNMVFISELLRVFRRVLHGKKTFKNQFSEMIDCHTHLLNRFLGVCRCEALQLLKIVLAGAECSSVGIIIRCNMSRMCALGYANTSLC